LPDIRKKESASFLKKRSKKLSLRSVWGGENSTYQIKTMFQRSHWPFHQHGPKERSFFCFFFVHKKEVLAYIPDGLACQSGAAPPNS
jgi:hypothetical protein